jgi:hypothetical protein
VSPHDELLPFFEDFAKVKDYFIRINAFVFTEIQKQVSAKQNENK